MPVPFLAPFATFRPDNFHIGGSVATLMAAALRWRAFGDGALEAAAAMRAMNDGGFVGSEGDRFRELVNAEFPSQLQVTGTAHVGVADAISRYATLLGERKAEMAVLEATARVSHAAVNTAVVEVNAAEAAVTAAPDPASKSAAAAVLAAAQAKHAAAVATWEGNLATAQGIRQMLGADVATQVAAIEAQGRKAFQENPKPWQAAWDAVSDWLQNHGDVLRLIADALQIIGGILMLICFPVGVIVLGVGLALKGLLAAAGVVSWGEFAFDAVTAGPLGALFKAAKGAKLGKAAANALTKASGKGSKTLSSAKAEARIAAEEASGGVKEVSQKISKQSTSGERCPLGGDPVNMATGSMVDFETDVFIDGVLPLVITRNAHSGYELGRTLGPRWVSTMDVRLEICTDEVLMLSSDGALLTFPPAPVDGSEVRADGRPWLLSYADGAYRVRDIAAGVTYSFRLFELDSGDNAGADAAYSEGAAGLKDESPSLGGTYVAATVPAGSLAEAFGAGIEVGLSSAVHHTGAAIEYTWDIASGHMVRMRRSDGTVIDCEWDQAVGRVAHVYVSNPRTHPDEAPIRLISYAYDAYGQLVRVINSHDGALHYHYDQLGRVCAWTDRNGVSYHYRFDDQGRVYSQVGTGGVFPNLFYWGADEGDDAPLGGRVCVALETAGEFGDDPLALGDEVVGDYFARLEQLPLYQALLEGGLPAAGLVGRGRTGERDDQSWAVPEEWLHDEVLGDIRPTVYRSTAAGDVWRVITPEGGVEDATYNEYHQKTSVTNSAGATTTFIYNEDGVVVETVYPDGLRSYVEPGAWAAPVRIVGVDGLATECEVDAFGLVKEVVTPDGAVTSFAYDMRPSGVVPASTTHPDGSVTYVECDDAGRVIVATDPAGRRVSRSYDVRGLLVEALDPLGESTRIEYTPEGWPARVVYPDGSTTSAAYDGEGNQIRAVNEIGATTLTAFSVFDKPVAFTDAAGATTRLEYNTQMELVRLRNADGNTWQYSYDLDGMVVCEVDYNGITTNTTLSPDGLISTVTTPAGTSTQLRHADGRIDKIRDDLGTTAYFYDEINRLTGIRGPQAEIAFGFDAYGRATTETVRLPSGETTTHALSIGHTGTVDAEHLTLPSGERFDTAFIRDGAGEVTASTHTRTLAGADFGDIVAEMRYGRDARGIRNKLSTGSVVRSFSTDCRGRRSADTLAALDAQTAGGYRTVSSRMFTWRDDGALSMVTDFLRGVTTFDLDVVGRVTRRATSPGNAASNAGTGRGAASVSGRTQPQGVVEERFGFSEAGVLNSISSPTPHSVSAPPSASGGVEALRGSGGGGGDDRVEFVGTMPTRVGRTSYTYDAAGRVTQTVTRRVSKKPLVHRFFYGTSAQPIGFSSSDQPDVGYRYVYDPLGRRVAKERIDTTTGEVLERCMFVHRGNQFAAEQVTFSKQSNSGSGYVWFTDPETGELTGQITLRPPGTVPANQGTVSQGGVDAEFLLIMADLAGSPQELVDTDRGVVAGLATQTLYGTRKWRGDASSPLLYAGQYVDAESGWAYNRFRYYHPHAGIYNAQDPLGVSPRIASAQGYVDHAAHWVDVLGLKGCPEKRWEKRNINGRDVYVQKGEHVFDPDKVLRKPLRYRAGLGDKTWTNAEMMAITGKAPFGVDGKRVNLHHIGQDDRSVLVEITRTMHEKNFTRLHIYVGLRRSQWPKDVIPVDRASFSLFREKYWKVRGMEYLNG